MNRQQAWSALTKALQGLLDSEGDGWMISHYVVVLGIEKVGDAEIKSSVWLAAPHGQPDYVSDGLLAAGVEMRENAEIEDD